jgi:hypothetical protein
MKSSGILHSVGYPFKYSSVAPGALGIFLPARPADKQYDLFGWSSRRLSFGGFIGLKIKKKHENGILLRERTVNFIMSDSQQQF